MIDRVLELLRREGRPLDAGLVLRDALGIESPNSAIADKVLSTLLRRDPRVRRIRGLWSLRVTPENPPQCLHTCAAFLFIEPPRGSGRPVEARGAVFIPETGFMAGFGPTGRAGGYGQLPTICRALSRRTVIAWSGSNLRLWKRLLLRHGISEPETTSVTLRALAESALEDQAPGTNPSDLAPPLGLPAPEAEDPISMARFLGRCWEVLVERVPEEHRTSTDALLRWINALRPGPDFTRFAFGPAFLRSLPGVPGVYVMRNRAGDILYVGKSGNLRRRVGSYFTKRALHDGKIRRIHDQLHSIDIIPAENEVEALLLEMRMIRDFRPPINLQEQVHEARLSYGRERNGILLVPLVGAGRAALYFLRGGVLVSKTSAALGRPPGKRLTGKIRSLYFRYSRRPRSTAAPWETEILSRWLSSNRDRLNFIDVDEAGTWDKTADQLSAYLQDPERLALKVHYR